jgi:hypothetical protein
MTAIDPLYVVSKLSLQRMASMKGLTLTLTLIGRLQMTLSRRRAIDFKNENGFALLVLISKFEMSNEKCDSTE